LPELDLPTKATSVRVLLGRSAMASADARNSTLLRGTVARPSYAKITRFVITPVHLSIALGPLPRSVLPMMRPVLAIALAMPLCALSAPTGNATKGQVIAARACAACHGLDGNSPLPANPNLAGQHLEYLYKQLRDFRSGERSNPIMTAMVAPLSDEDLRDLSAYNAAQEPAPLSAIDGELAAQGQKVFRGGISEKGVAACAGCHLPNGAGVPVQYPRIAGQHADYTSVQLRAFRAEERNNDENMVMRTIASRLSDKEIAALSEYLSGLR